MRTCKYCGRTSPEKVEHHTGHRPYGMKRDPNDWSKSIKDYDETATIVTIVTRWQAGDSLRAICRWLDDTGVTTRTGNNWDPTQIKRILVREGLIEP
jgi:hypothetical protein